MNLKALKKYNIASKENIYEDIKICILSNCDIFGY